jgi:hypothetical protein
METRLEINLDSESPDHSCTPKDWNCLPFLILHPSGDVVELKSWTSVDSVLFLDFLRFYTHGVLLREYE